MIRSGTHGNWQGLAEPIKAPRLSTARRIISLSFLIILSWGFKFSLAAQETSGGGASFLERLNQNQVIHSQSQQFQVIEPPITAKNIKDPEKAIEMDLMRLDGDLLVVMADRFAASFYFFLGQPRTWKCPVILRINPQADPDMDVVIQIRAYADRTWIIADLPYFISKKKLGRAMVNIVLREYIRQFPGRYDEPPPLWISRALEREFLTGTVWRPMLERNQRVHLNQQFVDAVTVSQTALHDQIPMSFEELSFPPPEAMAEELREYFDVSSHVFLRKICDLPEGRARLAKWLQSLKNHLNWQVPFMKAYEGEFDTFLELEKWWAIQGVKVYQRNELQLLEPAESLARLDQILTQYLPVEFPDSESSKPNDTSPRAVPIAQSLRSYLENTTIQDHQAALHLAYKSLVFLHAQSHPMVQDTLAIYANSIDAYLTSLVSRPSQSRIRNNQASNASALNRIIRDIQLADQSRLQLAARVAQLKYGLRDIDPLIPNAGSRVDSAIKR